MKCDKCGAEIHEGSNYCSNCGTPLKTEEPIHGNPLSEDYLKLRKYLITHKEWLLGYAVWFVINFFLLLFGGEKYRDKVYVYAPESFEYLVLLSKIVPVNQEMLEHTYDYADSKCYLSWERFYTELLKNNSSGTIYQYTKRNLNKTYLTQGNIKKIKENMPKAIL